MESGGEQPARWLRVVHGAWRGPRGAHTCAAGQPAAAASRSSSGRIFGFALWRLHGSGRVAAPAAPARLGRGASDFVHQHGAGDAAPAGTGEASVGKRAVVADDHQLHVQPSRTRLLTRDAKPQPIAGVVLDDHR